MLGIGHGAALVLDVKQRTTVIIREKDASDYDASRINANSETTPFQILAETGTLGGWWSVCRCWCWPLNTLCSFSGIKLFPLL